MIKHLTNHAKKIYASFTLISVEIILLLGIFSCALIGFISIAKMIFAEKKHAFDDAAFVFLSAHVSNVNTSVMEFFTFLGTHLFLIPANCILIAYFLFIKQHRWYSIKVPVVAISSLLLLFILKTIFQRQRPLTPLLEQARGYSFPSGHALMSITFYGLLIYLVWHNIKNNSKKWILITMLFLLIIFIGASRVYLRVHYASDVIAGFCVGFAWLIFSLWMLGKLEKYSSRKVDPMVQTGNASTA